MTNFNAISYMPPLDPERRVTTIPVKEVTLLEDRAQVMRSTSLTFDSPGLHRLVVLDVAPVLQDVSVHGRFTAAGARVIDVSARRAQRIRRADKPELVRELDESIEAQHTLFLQAGEAGERAQLRWENIRRMVTQALDEIPQDAAWGACEPEQWSKTLDQLLERGRALQSTMLEQHHTQQDLASSLNHLIARKAAALRPDHSMVAWIELDVVIETPGAHTLELGYVVPNAIWRPSHQASLVGDKVVWTCQATVWQFTGEDWSDAQLIFSTAQSALGTDPPLLDDDLLDVQKLQEQTVVAAREVVVQSAGPGGGAPPPDGVELPGVDDGGDVQTLRPESRSTIPSDGRPYTVPLLRFETSAKVELVTMPELSPRVFRRCTQQHTGKSPLLAGPVEISRDGGVVGWTKTMFVAPGERFVMGFGPEDAVRVARYTRQVTDKVDPDDKWRHRRSAVTLFASNLDDQQRKIVITERIPVSELKQVRIQVVDAKTTGKPTVDAHGMCRWEVVLEPYSQLTHELVWDMSTAPDVQGL
jgi:uncharacterized protein (TIGR02231 family)